MTDTPFIPRDQLIRLRRALPFWMSFLLIPLMAFVALRGGWWLALVPLATWYLFAILDLATGPNPDNADPETSDADLTWYTAITLLWVPLQTLMLFGLIAYATRADHLGLVEKIGLFAGVGIMTGTIGINYSHELMHQRNRLERWAADVLLAQVLYSHFRSEHLLVHHRYVATPRDPVTARYNEGFWAFLIRVLRQCPPSAWQAEKALLARKSRPVTDRANPFWRYAALQLACLALALALGGLEGLVLFLLQAAMAIWQLELVNYVEHYGLTRRHLGNGKYEHAKPHHSWNSIMRASNWLMINLARHSDHHARPDRRFPLLQTRSEDGAPELPYGYPVMTVAATIPPLWRRIMNPRVRAWRKTHYPDIADWSAYKTAENPMPV